MVSTKNLMKMVTKWRKEASTGRKRILLQRAELSVDSDRPKMGHFNVYTRDNRRFAIPLPYLYNDIFRELLKMSEEEFGLPRDGPITLPCESCFLEYVVSFIRKGMAKDEEKARLITVITSCCSLSSSLHQGLMNQHILICNSKCWSMLHFVEAADFSRET